MSTRTGLGLVAVSLGLISTTVQVLVIREQLIALTGNEVSVAVTLAAWLLLVAVGSLLAQKAACAGPSHVPSLLIIAGLAAPFQVVSVRALDAWVSPFGGIPGPGAMSVLAICGVLPSAAALGALFVALVRRTAEAGIRRPAALIYGLEGLGSGLAGLLLAVWLLEAANPVTIASLAGVLATAAAVYLVSGSGRALHAGPGRLRLGLAATAAAALTVAALAGERIDKATRQMQWHPFEVEATVDSKYGNLVVAGRAGALDFFETGSLAFTIPDRLYAEESVHLALLHHPEPRQVLVVGGAGAGVIAEIVKHRSVRNIDYLDIDPVIVSAIRDFAPAGWMEGTATARVRFLYDDARRYIATTRDMYDAVILNVGRPTSLQANRYYTAEFFRSAERILDRNGLLDLRVAAEGAYVGPETAALLGAVAGACRTVFPMVAILPGDYIHILASPGLDLRSETGRVIERLSKRGIDAAFVNQYTLWDRLSPRKIAEIDSVMAAYPPRAVNSDLRPVSLALALELWEKQAGGGRLLSRLSSHANPAGAVFALLAIGLVVAVLSGGAGVRAGKPFAGVLALYSVGLVTMATQILTIFSLQTTCGYIYTRIAGVVAAFMAGMGLASLYIAVRAPADRGRLAVPIQVALAALPLMSLAALRSLLAHPEALATPAADLAYETISFVAGALGGLAFATVSGRMIRAGTPLHEAAAIAYWADLAGATVAGLATGFVIIPALGIAGCAYSVAALSLVAALAVTLSRRSSPESLPR
jgi:spermidine synthase